MALMFPDLLDPFDFALYISLLQAVKIDEI